MLKVFDEINIFDDKNSILNIKDIKTKEGSFWYDPVVYCTNIAKKYKILINTLNENNKLLEEYKTEINKLSVFKKNHIAFAHIKKMTFIDNENKNKSINKSINEIILNDDNKINILNDDNNINILSNAINEINIF